MAILETRNVALEVDCIGNSADPAIVLIAGLGFQLIDWPLAFCRQLAAAGFYVIRFDNRDIGLSQKMDEKGIPDLAALGGDLMAGRRPAISYGLEDMATDVVGLLDGFSLNRAHMVGMSMGGMIAQLVAARYPDRCHSLTSIMSSSSDRSLPPPRPEAATILSSAPLSQAPADIIDFGLRVNDVIGSPGFRWDRKALRDHIANCVKRSYSPGGYLRQYAAVLSAPSRRDLLTKITLPSLVVHGTDDPLLPPACGQDVADHIRGAKMVLVPGMGHDLSPALCDHLATMILPHVRDA